MKFLIRNFQFLIILLCALPAQAVYQTNIVVNVTNTPTGNTQNLAIVTAGASTTRLWTNSVNNLALHIQTTNTIPWSRSNLYAHLILSRPAGVTIEWYQTTNIYIRGSPGAVLDVTSAGFWATLTTNVLGSASSVNNDIVADGSQLEPSVRTNDYSLLTTSLNNFSTNAFGTNAELMRAYGPKTNGIFRNPQIHDAEITNFTGVGINLLLSNLFTDKLNATNSIVWGDLYFGNTNTGVANNWAWQNPNADHLRLYNEDLLGWVYSVSNNGGVIRTWINNNSSQDITTNNGIFYSTSLHTPSLNATAFTISSGSKSNSGTLGTNQISAGVGYTWSEITGIVNGNNSLAPSTTKTFFNLSGNTATANICIITNWWDGRRITLRWNTGFNVVIVNESGVEVGAGVVNRILTGTGADITCSNQPGFVNLVYYGTRWNVETRSN